METEKFDGLVAAPFTPMNKKGEINPGLIPGYFDLLSFNGISGIFINGSTGEGVSLTLAEKKLLTKAWADAREDNKEIRIINLVGGTSLTECIELAKFSGEKGIDAVAVLAPFYFRPASVSELGNFIELVAGAVPGIPVYFYHIPVLTGVCFPMAGLLKFASERIGNFAGIKYTDENFADFLACLRYEGGRYDILWGSDETLLSALVLGAKGAVGSTYNYAAPLYHSIMGLFRDGRLEDARKLQHKSVEMVSLLGKYGGIGTGKAFMRYIGIDCGRFRPPVRSLSEDEWGCFCSDVKNLGMDHLLSKQPEKEISG